MSSSSCSHPPTHPSVHLPLTLEGVCPSCSNCEVPINDVFSTPGPSQSREPTQQAFPRNQGTYLVLLSHPDSLHPHLCPKSLYPGLVNTLPVYPDGRLLRSLSLSQVPSLFGSSLSVPPGWLLILMLYFPAHDIPRIPCNFHVLPCTQLCPFSWISPNIPPLVATGPGSRQPQFLQPSGGSQ